MRVTGMVAAVGSMVGLLAGPVLANDGFGGLSATGLTFGKTADVAMLDEALAISPDKISVDYVFKNTSAQDVAGEVIFPLPPINLADLQNEDWNLPADRNRDNLVDFQASVDGKPVTVQIDRIAVIEPENAWERPASEAYDTPGTDVTAKLAQFHIPLTLDPEAISTLLAGMTVDQRKGLKAAGLIDSYDGSDDLTDPYPLWSIVLRYHWAQVFPAGAEVKVHHDYENHPTGGVFTWTDPPTEDYQADLVKQYCIDAGTSRAIAKVISAKANDGTTSDFGMSLNIAYVLKTANSWAGPIGHFKLTLDKGSAKNVISLCADGVKKVGPTTFVVEKTDFTPTADLDILIVQPPGVE
jgi:hypothetical protein